MGIVRRNVSSVLPTSSDNDSKIASELPADESLSLDINKFSDASANGTESWERSVSEGTEDKSSANELSLSQSHTADNDELTSSAQEPVPEEPVSEEQEQDEEVVNPSGDEAEGAGQVEAEPDTHTDEAVGEKKKKKKKKKNRRSLHGSSASEETPPSTTLNVPKKKKKTVKVGSSNEPGGANQNEDVQTMEEAAAAEEKQRRKKKLRFMGETDAESTEDKQVSKSKKGDKSQKPGKIERGPVPPKRSKSSYIFFSMEERKQEDVSSLDFKESTKLISERWKELADDEKAPFKQQAKDDKQRYARELKKFEAENGPFAPKKAAANATQEKARSKKRKAREETECSDDDEEGQQTTNGTKIDRPHMTETPVLDGETMLPRARHPIRIEKISVGDHIVWIPQAFDVFVSNYDDTLQQLSLPDLPDEVSSELMRCPADGTANAAEVLQVSTPDEFAPGVDALNGMLLLRLKSEPLPGKEAEECEPLEYNLPCIDRSKCDVDQHVCPLSRYLESQRWTAGTGSASQLAVRFAVNEEEEEEWDGRVWDEQPFEPKEYPQSAYKKLRLIWYVRTKDAEYANQEPTLSNTDWILDNEQTDLEVSPWEASASHWHDMWAKKFPNLAKTHELRVERSSQRRLVPQPESEHVHTDASDAEQLVHIALKRLVSTEAASGLWRPVPRDETAYHSYIKNPISLSEIFDKAHAGTYVGETAWKDFAGDVQLLIDNAHDFNDEDTVWFSLASMLEREMNEVIRQIEEHHPDVLE